MSKIITLFGGESRERLVSVATAQNISHALPHALCWYWSPNGSVFEIDRQDLLSHPDVFKTELKPKNEAKYQDLLTALDSEQAANAVFVNAVHGGRGEDGTLQDWFEERGIAFTGPGSAACRLCMDKNLAKQKLHSLRARVAQSALISSQDLLDAENRILEFLKVYPKLMLKPNAEGSSFGLAVVERHSLDSVLSELRSHPSCSYLLEAYIHGVELTVGVVDNPEGSRALVPTELRAKEGFADYDGKYLGLGTTEITPAEVSDWVRESAQMLAVTAHQALGCEGYSRTDMIVDEEGPVFLETNALPGLTKASLVPQALAFEGVSIREFLDRQLENARVRAARNL